MTESIELHSVTVPIEPFTSIIKNNGIIDRAEVTFFDSHIRINLLYDKPTPHFVKDMGIVKVAHCFGLSNPEYEHIFKNNIQTLCIPFILKEDQKEPLKIGISLDDMEIIKNKLDIIKK